MIITRIIIVVGTILTNFETAARVGSHRDIDWATTMTAAAVAAKMFLQERRHNNIIIHLPICCLQLRYVLITGDH